MVGSNEIVIELRHVTTSFVQKKQAMTTTVFRHFNLQIKRGEFLVVVGASGAGKTTLLKLIAGLTLPDQGQILVGSRKLEGPSPSTVMVFQNPALFPWRTAVRNVELPLEAGTRRIRDPNQRRELARNALRKVRLGSDEAAFPKELSGGMQQRTALARSIVTDPEVLLMDEPFSGLDERTRVEMQRMLLDLWQDLGNTVVFVTHDIVEALVLADRLIVLGRKPIEFAPEFLLPGERSQRAEFIRCEDGRRLYDQVFDLLSL